MAEDATPLAATLNWILKDGFALLGGLFFSWRIGHLMDVDIKFFRLFADVANDVALTMELLTPLLPTSMFLPTVCIANILKALCGVAAGSTRASITSHFALRDNVADVSAKEQAQETAATLLGIVAGAAFLRVTSDSLTVVWTVFLVLTVLHVVANYKAVRCLRLRTFNPNRLDILLDRLLDRVREESPPSRDRRPWKPSSKRRHAAPPSQVLGFQANPREPTVSYDNQPWELTCTSINQAEPLLPLSEWRSVSLRAGASPKEVRRVLMQWAEALQEKLEDVWNDFHRILQQHGRVCVPILEGNKWTLFLIRSYDDAEPATDSWEASVSLYTEVCVY